MAETNKQKVGELLNEWKSDHRKLVARFDANDDGKIDIEEWEFARQLAILQIEKKNVNTPTSEAINIVANHPGSRYPFIISSKSQEKLAAKYRWSSLGYLVGFLLVLPILLFCYFLILVNGWPL